MNIKVKKVPRKFVIAIVAIIVLLLFAGILMFNYYGTFSIPSWARPTHDALEVVKDYHSNLDFDEISDSKLPRIDIIMDEDYMLSRDEYTQCEIQITNADKFDLPLSEAKLRIRGNSTSFADKKPYKIKFKEKTSLFGGGKEKSWVLLANVNDITGIHNYVSMKLYRYLSREDTFVPMVEFVNLYINGAYQGGI